MERRRWSDSHGSTQMEQLGWSDSDGTSRMELLGWSYSDGGLTAARARVLRMGSEARLRALSRDGHGHQRQPTAAHGVDCCTRSVRTRTGRVKWAESDSSPLSGKLAYRRSCRS